MTHLLSAFVSQGEDRLIFSQLAIEDKSNEIVAIPRLLDLLDLKGAVVTIDAIGCQRPVAAKVIAGGADCVLPVKENQPTLLSKMRTRLNGVVLDHAKGIDDKARVSYFEQNESGHSRLETWRVWVSDEIQWFGKEVLALWPGLGSIALVDRTRQDLGDLTGKVSVERQVYISSVKGIDAATIAAAVRGIGRWRTICTAIGRKLRRRPELHPQRQRGTELLTPVPNRFESAQARHEHQGGLKTKPLNAGWDHDYLRRLISA